MAPLEDVFVATFLYQQKCIEIGCHMLYNNLILNTDNRNNLWHYN